MKCSVQIKDEVHVIEIDSMEHLRQIIDQMGVPAQVSLKDDGLEITEIDYR